MEQPLSLSLVGLGLAALLAWMAGARRAPLARPLSSRLLVAAPVAVAATLAIEALSGAQARVLERGAAAVQWLDGAALARAGAVLLYVVALGGLHLAARATEHALARRCCKVRRCIRVGWRSRRVIAGEILVRGAW